MYYQQGGQQDQIMQLIQAYAQINQIDPSQLMQQLQQMPAEQQQEAIQQMAESLQQSSEQPDMTQAAMAYGGYTTGVFADGGEMIRRADGSYSKRGLWDNVRANKGSGKKPTKQMLEQEKKIRAQEAAYGGMFANGGTNNAGFNALPDYVQAKILSNMGYGGYYDPMQLMDEGGEPNGGMALGQMSAVADKMSKLRQFVSPEQNLDPWIASKLAVMDHSADAISDYMMYNAEAQGEEMEMEEQEMRRGGSTFSGNAFYQDGGEPEPQLEDYPDYGSWRADVYRNNAAQASQKMPLDPTSAIVQAASNVVQSTTPAQNTAAATPSINYDGVSIVDLLSSAGKASDYNSRKQLAAQLGIDNYYGSAKQNLDLIKKVTSNPAVLNDYKPVATPRSSSPKRQSSGSTSQNSSPSQNTPPVTQTASQQNSALDSIFAQQKKLF